MVWVWVPCALQVNMKKELEEREKAAERDSVNAEVCLASLSFLASVEPVLFDGIRLLLPPVSSAICFTERMRRRVCVCPPI